MRLYLLRAAAAAPLFPIFQINIVSIYYQAISTTYTRIQRSLLYIPYEQFVFLRYCTGQ